ncbi:thrombospondin type 1 domain-containing protein, putative [Eimeria acervulina]|uniref:Thrombospondin type 1 domain-containing protein, putative n=1 Tax=Eimeria acervulina TaxID=5801 RepID=U6GGX6_EIMAC|nr:thrombospondin type 1 domain-containing protein, putative [Eimeria acervulina]CDI78508.1 thrombospondin type 1 domain-containing protein, putative [Eimeria acervulina]
MGTINMLCAILNMARWSCLALDRHNFGVSDVGVPRCTCAAASLTTTTSTTAPTWDWPKNADCLPGDWSECLQGPTPVRRRRRPQLLPSRGNGAPCILEETVPCVFDTSIPCDSLCRHSEWTEWSSCSEKLLEFGFSPVTTSYREKLVSAEAGEACSALDLKEYDASRCNGQGDNDSKTQLQPSALQMSSTKDAVVQSEKWCLLNGQSAKRYKLSIRQNSSAEDAPVYHSTQIEDCPNSLGPCRNDREPSCDDLVPVHDILEERQFCKEQCQKIIDLCSKEAMLKGKTPLQCFADYVTENQPVGGKCTYTQKLVKETTTPTCFPSFSRMNDDETSQFRFLDPNSPSPQCLCLTPDSVPCTATEVFESRHISLAAVPSCPHQNTAGALFGDGTPGTADSKLFFAAADSAKIFCPLSNSKNFQQQEDAATYTVFQTAAEMNEYCANGLEEQHDLSASTPLPRIDSVSAEECESKCREIKEDCADSTFDYLSCIATRRETTGFNAQCSSGDKGDEGGTVQTEPCSFQEICAVIPLSDFGLFDCETRTFKESVVDFNDLTAEDQCSTDQFSSVFCVVADDVETERRHMMITMLIMLLGGTFLGIAFVLWFIQHSVDVQKVLGLRGRYVELVNMVKE